MVKIDFGDLKAMRKLMNESYKYPQMLFGHNEDDETTITSIFNDHISVSTLQFNGWTRVNTLWFDGTTEEWFTREQSVKKGSKYPFEAYKHIGYIGFKSLFRG